MKAARRGLAALLLISMTAIPGRGETVLRPGLHATWRIELLAEGKRSEDRLSLDVVEEVESGRWTLDIRHGGDTWRLLYRADGELPHFSPERVLALDQLEDGQWRSRGSDDLAMLNPLVLMELRLSGAQLLGDTVQLVSGREMHCRRYALQDAGESVQEGPTVTLRTQWTVSGEVWISSEVPLAGWVRYREERTSRKVSEIGGQVFEGGEESGITEWILEEWRSP